MSTDRRKRPRFGKPDPFCWLAVVPFLIIAVVLFFSTLSGFCFVPAVIAGLIVLFDARVNRPG